MSAIEVAGLRVAFGTTVAVHDVSFEADAGSITVLLGPNGAGKTTTLDCVAGFRRPDRGTIRVLGLDPVDDVVAIHRRLGVMLQQGGLHTGIRPAEALRMYAAFFERPRDPGELLEMVGLTERSRTPWRSLSGGEQQRLSLALALVGRPEAVILDEPTAGVDVAGKLLIRDLVRRLRGDGLAVLVTTHDLAEVEDLADRIVIIDAGRVVAIGTPAELLAAGDHHDIRFRARPGLPIAELEARLGARVAEVEPGSYVVETTPDPAVVATLTAWLASHDELVGDLVAGRRGLEEVFLRLTSEETPAEARGRARGSGRSRGRGRTEAGRGGRR